MRHMSFSFKFDVLMISIFFMQILLFLHPFTLWLKLLVNCIALLECSASEIHQYDFTHLFITITLAFYLLKKTLDIIQNLFTEPDELEAIFCFHFGKDKCRNSLIINIYINPMIKLLGRTEEGKRTTERTEER